MIIIIHRDFFLIEMKKIVRYADCDTAEDFCPHYECDKDSRFYKRMSRIRSTSRNDEV